MIFCNLLVSWMPRERKRNIKNEKGNNTECLNKVRIIKNFRLNPIFYMSQIHLLFFLRTNSLNLLVEIREEFFPVHGKASVADSFRHCNLIRSIKSTKKHQQFVQKGSPEGPKRGPRGTPGESGGPQQEQR